MQNIIKNKLSELGIYGRPQRYALAGSETAIVIKKAVGDTDFTKHGAVRECEKGDRLEMTVKLPRCAGLCQVRLSFCADGGDNEIYCFSHESFYTEDVFKCSIPTEKLPCGLSAGLYYYHLELCFGSLVLYTQSVNNADFVLTQEYPENRFMLLVYERDFTTPDWFCGNIMYHIFVDRFFKGTTAVKVSDTAVINPDWDNGIPQYGEYPGAFVENNVFFGGTLWGIAEKLDYLESLGVGCIYLSPIFKAYSNHKYDTGDYMTVDEMFGGEAALKKLIEQADIRNIRIIIDGVFNHTGDDSLYFNRYGRYNSVGAYGNEASPYRSWYCFENDGSYKSWWGVEILPKLNLLNCECADYFLGSGGVLEKYLDMGVAGVRLDVADELPTEFLERLRETVRKKKSDGLIIGEVWENAADKVAYGERRRYFRGRQIDSVMNYPQKNAVTEFVKNGDSEFFYNTITELYACYPKQCSDVLMNILGTHDTDRILTVLGADASDGLTNAQLAVKRMTKPQRLLAIKRLKLACVLQYTLFGTPSVFYGDEVGLEGYRDPFCRLPFPWGREESELCEHYRLLGRLRKSEKVFEKGNFEFTGLSVGFVSYRRFDDSGEILIMANASEKTVSSKVCGEYKDLMTGKIEKGTVKVPAASALILKRKK